MTQTKRVKPYENFSGKLMVLVRLCTTNNISGTVIKPEKETAFPRSIISLRIWFEGLKKNWKITRKDSEVKITKITLVNKSLNEIL